MKNTENNCFINDQKSSAISETAATGSVAPETIEQLRSSVRLAIEAGQEENRAVLKQGSEALAVAHAREAAGAAERARAIIEGIPEAIRKETASLCVSSGGTLSTIIMTLNPLEAIRLPFANGNPMHAALTVWEYCRLAGLKPRLETRKLPRHRGTHFATSWVILVQWTVPEHKAS